MTFRANLKRLMKRKLMKNRHRVTAGRKSGKDCGPGHHRHPDAFQNKCHRMDQKHTRKQVGPNNTPNSMVKKTIKKLEIH